MRAISLVFALACAAGPAEAQWPEDRRGPAEFRDEQLLAQPRLTLPATSAATLPRGGWSIEADSLWSSTFNWDQDVPGENPKRRSFLIDGETLTLAPRLRYGLRPRLEVGVRLPLRWRGGGVMDEIIDGWHQIARLPDGNRPDFLSNRFRAEGRLNEGGWFTWNGARGSGIGNLELETRWRFAETAGASAAVVARLALPTGTGVFSGHGAAAGIQLVADAPLSRSTDLYAGFGGTLQRRGPVGGLDYEPARAHVFLALEWRPWRAWSLIVETNAGSRLVSNVDGYPGTHWLLDISVKHPLGRRAELVLGFSEGLISQLNTTDFGAFVGMSLRP